MPENFAQREMKAYFYLSTLHFVANYYAIFCFLKCLPKELKPLCNKLFRLGRDWWRRWLTQKW